MKMESSGIPASKFVLPNVQHCNLFFIFLIKKDFIRLALFQKYVKFGHKPIVPMI